MKKTSTGLPYNNTHRVHKRATKGRSNKEEVMTSTPRSEGWQSSRPLNCCRTREKSSLPLLPIDLSPVDYKVRSAAERYRRGDWRHSQYLGLLVPTEEGPRPKARTLWVRWEALSAITGRDDDNWRVGERLTNEWLGLATSRRDCRRATHKQSWTLGPTWLHLRAPRRENNKENFPWKKIFKSWILLACQSTNSAMAVNPVKARE